MGSAGHRTHCNFCFNLHNLPSLCFSNEKARPRPRRACAARRGPRAVPRRAARLRMASYNLVHVDPKPPPRVTTRTVDPRSPGSVRVVSVHHRPETLLLFSSVYGFQCPPLRDSAPRPPPGSSTLTMTARGGGVPGPGTSLLPVLSATTSQTILSL